MIVEQHLVSDLIKEGRKYQDEIKDKLKDVKVPVNTKHPHVLESIRQLFGDDYIVDGKAYIDFEMCLQCLTIIRNVGRAQAEELKV